MSNSSLSIRKYQELIVEQAKERNTIVFLPTGTGKTLIACHLVGHRVWLSRKSGGRKKVIVFIAPTKALLSQQLGFIEKHCPETVKTVEIKRKSQWTRVLEDYQVLGMTPEVFRFLLEGSDFPAEAVDTVIIDECHHATKDHPMARMCELIHNRGLKPLILGLTASPTHSKKGDARSDFTQLENSLRAHFFVPPPQIAQSLAAHRKYATPSIEEYEEKDYTTLKALSCCLRRCIELDTLHYAGESTHFKEYDLLCSKLCGRKCNPNPTFRRIAQLSALENLVGRIANVTGSTGYYCGLLALLDALETSSASAIRSMTTVIAQRQIKEIDSQCFPYYLSSLFSEARDDPSLFILWHDQLRCFLEVFASLAIEIVRGVVGEDLRLLFHIEHFQEKPTKDDLMGVVLERILDDSELSSRQYDKFEDFSYLLPQATATFMASLWMLLNTLKNNISLRPLAVHLGSPSSALLREAIGDHLLSPKVLRLLEVLYEPFRSADKPNISTNMNSRQLSRSAKGSAASDTSAIVFCEMQLLVKILQKVFDQIGEVWREVRREAFPILAVNMTGEDSATKQRNALDNLKTGRANVLFATEVVEEGIDVKSCSLIVNYDSPKTVKSFIQRRGRARAEDAQFVCFISEPYQSQSIYKDLITFMEQECESERVLQDWLSIASDNSLSSGSDDSEDCYTVPTTRASVNAISDIGLLVNDCCNSLAERSRDVRPPFYEQIGSSFTDTLTLPAEKAHLSAFTSDHRGSKISAKGHATVLAERELHSLGRLDEGCSSPSSGVPDMINVQIKSVPDILSGRASITNEQIILYLYVFRVDIKIDAKDSLSWKTRKQIEAVESVGFAFVQPLSAEIMEQAPRIFFQNLDKDIIACLTITEYESCKHALTRIEFKAMVLFHQSIFCLQINEMNDPDSLDGFMSNSMDCAIKHLKCSKCSVGAFLFAFPLPNNSSKSFGKHLISAAKEARLLVYNLCVLARNKEKAIRTRKFFPVTPCSMREVHNKGDLLISSTGCNLLYCGKEHNQNLSQQRRLSDEMPNSHITYREHFAKRNMQFSSLINHLSKDPNYRLANSLPVSGKLSLNDLLKPSPAKEKADVNHVVVLEGCQLLGNAKWYFVSLVLPGLAHRVKSLLLAEEAIQWVRGKVENNQSAINDIALMLEAITPKMAFEHQNNEALEFYGDSVLKYLASVTLFCQSSSSDQESLTKERAEIINNVFLADRCQQEGLSKYLRGLPLSRGLEEVLVPPPTCDFSLPSLRNSNVQRCFPTSTMMEMKTLYGSVQEVSVGRKTLADLFEAVLGMVYLSTEQSDEVASIFLTSVGVLKNTIESSKERFQRDILDDFPTSQLIYQAKELKKMFHHTFRYPQLLIEALVHKSTGSSVNYERLEFLGDAVLDMIVVNHLSAQDEMKEGQMTVEKSKRTNNHRLAEIASTMGLDKFIFHNNLNFRSKALEEDDLYLLDDSSDEEYGNDNDDDDSRGTAVKVLADVLEAVIGAIYLDCGFDLGYVQRIVKRLGLLEC